MSSHHVMQPQYPIGLGRRKGNKDISNKPNDQDERLLRFITNGVGVSGRIVGDNGMAQDRFVFLTSCLIGHHVNVQVKNGSIYSGIFHSINSEKDFGVILKMAKLIEGALHGGQKSVSESSSRSPLRTLIIPANELVQVIAKDVSITAEGLASSIRDVKEKDILIDSYISQSHPGEMERELERWVPDETDPLASSLDNIFDVPRNRGWDQFQANESLFGVKSTFDEELYTTKLERGPQMRELEKEALRIAREIEGEETHDLHLAEERGVILDEQFDIDEESKYSSVLREINDCKYEDNYGLEADSLNDDTFGASFISSLAEGQPSQPCPSRGLSNSTSSVDAETSFASVDSEARGQEDPFFDDRSSSKETFDQLVLVKKTDTTNGSQSSYTQREPKLAKSRGQPGLTANSSAGLNDLDTKDSSSCEESTNASASSPTGGKEGEKIGRKTDTTNGSQSSNSQREPKLAKSYGQTGLTPNSSVGSLSSEKSTLNPHAKEFKLNPNAKSFLPIQTTSSASFYYPNSNPHMPGMPISFGIGPSFASPEGAPHQSPQGYFHPYGPQYAQHMVLGPTRPAMYMPGYPPEMTYKREY